MFNSSAIKKTSTIHTPVEKAIGIPSDKSSLYWEYVDSTSIGILRDASVTLTDEGRDERASHMGRVDNYPILGPTGAIDPELPVFEVDLHAGLNDPACDLYGRWGESNIFARPKILNKECPTYKPSWRAAATSARARIPGDNSHLQSRRSVIKLDKTRLFGEELMVPVNDVRGKDFRLSGGICARGDAPGWRDIILVELSDSTFSFPYIDTSW